LRVAGIRWGKKITEKGGVIRTWRPAILARWGVPKETFSKNDRKGGERVYQVRCACRDWGNAKKISVERAPAVGGSGHMTGNLVGAHRFARHAL